MIKKNKKRKFKKRGYLLSVIIIIGAIGLIFNDFGLKHLINLKDKKDALNTNIQQIMAQQISLQQEINKLTNDTIYLEKIAREKFMMVKPGEKIFRVIESKTSQ
tara:strand:+ start:365 stop:676 length:312 start_codon:yes stop_codon:yes gene_type:complete